MNAIPFQGVLNAKVRNISKIRTILHPKSFVFLQCLYDCHDSGNEKEISTPCPLAAHCSIISLNCSSVIFSSMYLRMSSSDGSCRRYLLTKRLCERPSVAYCTVVSP